MSAPLRRGACPTLGAPMRTGDGWLARMALAEGMTPAQLAALAAAAVRHGNGMLEVTGRGSLQIRGLPGPEASGLAALVADIGLRLRTGLAVETGPLAGLDAAEAADPRPLAAAIRREAARLGLAAWLGPKVSVAVDGGGALLPGTSDICLRADGGAWLVALAGRVVVRCAEAEAADVAIALLLRIAERGPLARGNDLEAPPDAPALPRRRAALPIGAFALRDGGNARGVGLAFGQAHGDTLAALAEAAAPAWGIRLASRGLLVVGLAEHDAAFVARARSLGAVVDPGDPRLAIVACAGAPACRSAHLATRRLAEDVARRPDLLDGVRLHLSGCAKGCARPAWPAVTLVGDAAGAAFAAGQPQPSPPLRAYLVDRAARAEPREGR